MKSLLRYHSRINLKISQLLPKILGNSLWYMTCVTTFTVLIYCLHVMCLGDIALKDIGQVSLSEWHRWFGPRSKTLAYLAVFTFWKPPSFQKKNLTNTGGFKAQASEILEITEKHWKFLRCIGYFEKKYTKSSCSSLLKKKYTTLSLGKKVLSYMIYKSLLHLWLKHRKLQGLKCYLLNRSCMHTYKIDTYFT